MLTLRHLVVQTDLRALLRGHVVLPMIELQEPVVRLESSATGSPNWLFLTHQDTATPTTPPTTLPTIGRVTLHAGSVSYHDYSTGTTFAGTLSEVRAQTTGPEQSVDVTGSGQFEHRPFQLTVYAGALPALQANDPSPVRGQFVLGEWSTRFAGTIARPLELAGVDMDVLLEGRHPAPADPADASASRQQGYHLTGHLTRQTDAWKIEGLKGTLGNSSVARQLVIDMQDKRPFLRADLTSDTLKVDDMTGVLAGSPVSAKKQEAGPDDTPSTPLLNIEITRAAQPIHPLL